MARFYAAVTGLRPVGVEDYVERTTDLFNAGAAVAATNRSVIFEFEVHDVDRERLRLERVVGEFVMEPTDHP